MLAQSAVRGGWRPLVIDLFGDQDTRRLAAQCVKLRMDGVRVDAAVLRATVCKVVREHPDIGLIYGSGVETEPGLVADLCDGMALIGNNPETVARVKNPERFFALLRRLAIPFPEVRFKLPDDTRKWLRKSASGQGGEVVRTADRRSENRDEYFQRLVKGTSQSVLFLADGQNAQIIGFNRQWVASHDPERPFRFSGIINRGDLNQEQRATITNYVHNIVRATSLRGLNSLDFIKRGDICLMLEINPRPSASMALYDEDFPKGLVDAHVAACQNDLYVSRDSLAKSPVRAYQIVYASCDVTVPRMIDWPEWCADRPPAGTIVPRGQPLCSVRASGDEEREVLRDLQNRAVSILEWYCGLRQMA